MLNINELQVLLVLIDRVDLKGSEAEAVVGIKTKIRAIIEQIQNPPSMTTELATPGATEPEKAKKE